MVGKSIKEVLDNLSTQLGLNYSQKGSYIVLSSYKAKETSAPVIAQQKKTITGVVTDDLGEPIIGANVIEKGTTNGIITDIDDKFTLEVAPGAVVQVSYIGYNTQEVKVGNQSTLAIQLVEDTQALSEVVVVGYGVQRKVTTTGAVTKLEGDEINKMTVCSSCADQRHRCFRRSGRRHLLQDFLAPAALSGRAVGAGLAGPRQHRFCQAADAR